MVLDDLTPLASRRPARRGRGVIDRWAALSVGGVALAIALLAWSLSDGYFATDDFVNVNVSRDSNFGWGYLSQSLFGHFLPGYRFAFALQDRVFGGAWWPSIVFQCASLATCAWLVDRLGQMFAAGPRTRCVAVVVFAFTLLHVRSVVWFAAALNGWPCNLAALVVIVAAVKHLRTGRWWWAAIAAAALGIGITFFEQAIVAGIALAVMALLFREELAPGLAAREFWRRAAVVGGACAAVTFVYWGYYFSRPYSDELPERAGASAVVKFVWYALVEGMFPATIGIHVARIDSPGERLGAAIVGLLAVTLIVAAAAAFRRQTWRVWVLVAAVVLPHVLLVAVSRAGRAGPTYGRELRYFSDLAWLLPVVVILIARCPTRPVSPSPLVRTVGAGAAAAMLALVVVVSAVNTRAEFRVSPSWQAASYLERFRATVPDIGTAGFAGVYDTEVPCCVQYASLYPYNVVSLTIGLFEPRARPVLAPSHLVDRDGSVVAAEFEVDQSLTPSLDCADLEGRRYVDLPIGAVEQSDDLSFLRVEWTGSATGAVEVVGGDAGSAGPTVTATLYQDPLPLAATDRAATIALPATLPDKLWFRVYGTGELCLTSASIGAPIAAS